MAAADRRVHPRQVIVRPCKVFHRPTQKYLSATTSNVSAGGALLEIVSARPIQLGDRIDVGVAWSRSPVLLEDALVEASVIRTCTLGNQRQEVAVRFDRLGLVAAAA
jgi:hypothetical protein